MIFLILSVNERDRKVSLMFSTSQTHSPNLDTWLRSVYICCCVPHASIHTLIYKNFATIKFTLAHVWYTVHTHVCRVWAEKVVSISAIVQNKASPLLNVVLFTWMYRNNGNQIPFIFRMPSHARMLELQKYLHLKPRRVGIYIPFCRCGAFRAMTRGPSHQLAHVLTVAFEHTFSMYIVLLYIQYIQNVLY